MQKIDDDITNSRQVFIQARLTRFLAKGIFQDRSKCFRDVSKVVGLDADCAESSTCYVELVAQPHVDIRYLALGCAAARPLSERFEQLLRGD